MGQFCKESNKSVREECIPDPKSPRAASTNSPIRNCGKLVYPKSTQVSKAERSKKRPAMCEAPWQKCPAVCEAMAKDGGKIAILAATYSNPAKATGNTLFMDSFLGGKQLHLRSDAVVEYTLVADLLTPTIKQCNLACLVFTVHRNEMSVLLTVASDSNDVAVAVFSAEFPYTIGRWQAIPQL
jgi:hypothetical protein